MTDSIVEILKTGTEEHHKNIEGAIPVMREDLRPEEYQEILRSFYGFYKSFEASLERHSELAQLVPDLHQRKKLELLKADLEFLGVEEPAISSLPGPETTPAAQSLYHALGALYVMEGSTLGGQIISKHLKHRLGFEADAGANYYNSYGSKTGKMWQDFKAVLKTHVQTEEQKRKTLEGAQETFVALQKWMSPSST